MESETIHIKDSWCSSYAALQIVLTYMQIFKACTFSANPCIWQAAWRKARAHTPSHKQQGTCAQALKSFEDLQSVHESRTAPQSTRTYVARKLLPQCSSHSFEQRTRTEKNMVHGAEDFLGAPPPEILPSLVRFGARLRIRHIW